MSERLFVTDSNIFFDLVSVDLLDEFFRLPYEIHTTDFVIGEILDEESSRQINGKITAKDLTVKTFDGNELSEIVQMYNTSGTNASVTDCSVWYYARQISAKLITGDGKLRRIAENDGLDVSGILFVFDLMICEGLITESVAGRKLADLMSINSRLPLRECQKRLAAWT